MNRKAIDLYNRSEDKYFEMPEHLKKCKFRQQVFSVIRRIRKEAESNSLARSLSLSLSKWVTTPKK